MKNKQQHSGLGIPASYFSDLESEILREIETQNSESFLKESFGTDTGMKIPKSYGAMLQREILLSKTSSNVFSMKRLVSGVSAIAAVLVISFVIYTFNQNEVTSEIGFEELLAQSSITEDYLDYLELEDLSWAIEETTKEEETLPSLESLDYLLEDDDFLEELVSNFDNLQF